MSARNARDLAYHTVRSRIITMELKPGDPLNDRELAEEYGVQGLTACPMMQAGQIFYADYAKPEGFCDEAWKAIYQYVFALSHGMGDELFYYGDWIRKPGVAICSCNDGLRPVIFKLEATDEESVIDYEPITR